MIDTWRQTSSITGPQPHVPSTRFPRVCAVEEIQGWSFLKRTLMGHSRTRNPSNRQAFYYALPCYYPLNLFVLFSRKWFFSSNDLKNSHIGNAGLHKIRWNERVLCSTMHPCWHYASLGYALWNPLRRCHGLAFGPSILYDSLGGHRSWEADIDVLQSQVLLLLWLPFLLMVDLWLQELAFLPTFLDRWCTLDFHRCLLHRFLLRDPARSFSRNLKV